MALTKFFMVKLKELTTLLLLKVNQSKNFSLLLKKLLMIILTYVNQIRNLFINPIKEVLMSEFLPLYIEKLLKKHYLLVFL